MNYEIDEWYKTEDDYIHIRYISKVYNTYAATERIPPTYTEMLYYYSMNEESMMTVPLTSIEAAELNEEERQELNDLIIYKKLG